METPTTDLIAAITQYLKEREISGNSFAKGMGMNPSHWSRIRRRIVPPGGKFLKAVADSYPDLAPAVAAHFLGGKAVS